MIVGAELVDGKALEGAIAQLLGDPRAAYLQAHFAKFGCYAARIERAEPPSSVRRRSVRRALDQDRDLGRGALAHLLGLALDQAVEHLDVVAWQIGRAAPCPA